jgi:hypothetical protein
MVTVQHFLIVVHLLKFLLQLLKLRLYGFSEGESLGTVQRHRIRSFVFWAPAILQNYFEL